MEGEERQRGTQGISNSDFFEKTPLGTSVKTKAVKEIVERPAACKSVRCGTKKAGGVKSTGKDYEKFR